MKAEGHMEDLELLPIEGGTCTPFLKIHLFIHLWAALLCRLFSNCGARGYSLIAGRGGYSLSVGRGGYSLIAGPGGDRKSVV